MLDLIDESAAELSAYGYTVKNEKRYGISVGLLQVDSPQKSKRLGFAQGDYVIVNAPLVNLLDGDCYAFITNLLAKHIAKLKKRLHLRPKCKTLVVGVGNPDIAADSLGKRVVDKIEKSTDKNNRLYKICPNVHLNTGIATHKIISILANALKVENIIIVDSLCTSSLARLGTSFQINTAGLTPGSASQTGNKKLDYNSLGIKCISIGVPLIINSTSLAGSNSKEVLLASKDVSSQVETASDIIADAINKVLG